MNINGASINQTARDVSKLRASEAIQVKPSNHEQVTDTDNKNTKDVAPSLILHPDLRDPLKDEYSRGAPDYILELAITTFDMRDVYTQVQEDLFNQNPDLSEKDWDFTVDEMGELLVLEGQDKLTDEEMQQIKGVLEDNNMDDYTVKLANSIIGLGVADRGPELWSDEGVGVYDVTKETMQDILRGRELMSDSKVKNNQILGTGYFSEIVRDDQKMAAPEHFAAISSYNKNKMMPMEAIMKQLSARGEEKYNNDPSVDVKL